MNHELLLFTASSETPDLLIKFLGFVFCAFLMLMGFLIGWFVWKGFGKETQRLDEECRRLGRILNARENVANKHEDKITRLLRKG